MNVILLTLEPITCWFNLYYNFDLLQHSLIASGEYRKPIAKIIRAL